MAQNGRTMQDELHDRHNDPMNFDDSDDDTDDFDTDEDDAD